MTRDQTPLGQLIRPAKARRAATTTYPILSMTMHSGLVDQSNKFKKRVASADTSQYRVVTRSQLVVGFPIDEGVLSFQRLYDEAIVSPAYDVWDLIDTHSIDTSYLERFLRSPRALSFYRSKLRGTTARRRTLPDDIFLSLMIPVVPLPEQRRIAGILDKAGAMSAKRQAALAKLDTVTQSIFLDMFGDPESNPRGWEVIPLAGVVRPGTIVTYGIVQAGDECKDGIPYIRTGDIVNGEIVTTQLRRTAPEIAARFARSRVDVGDIVISIRATVGTTALVPPFVAGANLTQGTARIAPSKRVMGPYLLHMLRTPGIQNWIQRQVKGATFREITLTRLRELPVIVPPVAEQKAFLVRCDAVQDLKRLQRESAFQSDDLFASLQHRAFRGEL